MIGLRGQLEPMIRGPSEPIRPARSCSSELDVDLRFCLKREVRMIAIKIHLFCSSH